MPNEAAVTEKTGLGESPATEPPTVIASPVSLEISSSSVVRVNKAGTDDSLVPAPMVTCRPAVPVVE